MTCQSKVRAVGAPMDREQCGSRAEKRYTLQQFLAQVDGGRNLGITNLQQLQAVLLDALVLYQILRGQGDATAIIKAALTEDAAEQMVKQLASYIFHREMVRPASEGDGGTPPCSIH